MINLEIVLKEGYKFKDIPSIINGYRLKAKDLKSIELGSYNAKQLRATTFHTDKIFVFCKNRSAFYLSKKGVRYIQSMIDLKLIDNIGSFTWIKEIKPEALKGKREDTESEIAHKRYISEHRVFNGVKPINLDNRWLNSNKCWNAEEFEKKMRAKRAKKK